jgi:voltage-gated potassium channel Kch
MIWSIFYTVLLEISPHALKGVDPGTWYDNYPTATYFSFVTLTTLGYGDISPATPIAEVIVILEAVTGMFYLAVIVASLIGAMRNKN